MATSASPSPLQQPSVPPISADYTNSYREPDTQNQQQQQQYFQYHEFQQQQQQQQQQQHQQDYHQSPPLQFQSQPQPLLQPNEAQSSMSPQYEINSTGNHYAQTSHDDSYDFGQPSAGPKSTSVFVATVRQLAVRYQLLLDASAPHWAARWAFSLALLVLFMLRVILSEGWYVICYALSIYYLNLFIGFLSPKIDPAFQAEYELDDPDDSASGPMLPTRANDEFRPFIRRLPEFKFWLSATTATLISLFLTLFEVFDLPVFWPILLLYFILLFVSTMRQQIKHMIKYGYVPWDKGKKRYGRQNEEPNKLFSTASS